MARNLNGTNQYYTTASGLGVAANDPVSIVVCASLDDFGAAVVGASLGVSGASLNQRRLQFETTQLASARADGGTGSNNSAQIAYTVTGSHKVTGAEFRATNDRWVWTDLDAPVQNTGNQSMSAAPTAFRIGATMSGGGPFDGPMKYAAIYAAALTDDTRRGLAARWHPSLLQPDDLIDVFDFTGRSTERGWKGTALTLTGSNPAFADNPRLFYPRRRSSILVPGSSLALTLPTIASTATLAVPTLAAGAVALALPAIASTAVLLAPALSAGVVALGLPAIAAGSVLSAPALTAGAVTVSLPAIGSTASLAAPAIGAGAVSVGMPTIASGAVLTAPAVAPGVAAVALPNIGTTATLFAPTVIGAGAVALPAIASTASLAPPTLTAGAVAVSLPAIASSSATYAPTLAGVATLALPTIASQSALYAPALVPGVLSLALPTLASTSALFSPTIIDGVIPTYTTIVLGAARAGVARITARAGRSSITARTHLTE